MKTLMKLAFSIIVVLCAFPFLYAEGERSALEVKKSSVDALFKDFEGPNVPGASVMIIKDGKVLYKKAYGQANLEKRIECTTKTNFRIASMTKQFTAAAILILSEQKKLSLNDDLVKLFPDFPEYGKAITIRHLLNHTSGLIDYGELITKDSTVPLKERDVLEMLKRQDHTYFAPGSKWRYSNTGYVLLGMIVETASGMPFPEFVEKNIFKRLGMNRSRFYQRDDYSDSRRAIGYTKRDNGFEVTDQSLTSSLFADGSIYTSVEDLYKWDQALYTSRLMSNETLKQAFTGSATIDAATSYGFGWFVSSYEGRRRIGHGGSTIGFQVQIDRFPDQRFTVVVLTNRNKAPVNDLVQKIIDIYSPTSK